MTGGEVTRQPVHHKNGTCLTSKRAFTESYQVDRWGFNPENKDDLRLAGNPQESGAPTSGSSPGASRLVYRGKEW